ncbi:hypothetical protein FH972_021636 [Carpinus fangiana]|uniref:Uncharacterized protein n=1 Tax=Carpinus fangiana TaxID=176857 RepID=A0A5N6KS16_9ROSI|nr:hypothetical protein FH972_021636 [Carpinus fangiana]
MKSLILLAAAALCADASPLQKRAGWPASGPTFTVSELGSIFDNTFPGIQRDGGGSGAVNGFKSIFFSDSFGNDNQGNSYFVSNTLTYYGSNDPTNPLDQSDFGDSGRPNQQLFNSDGDKASQVGDRVAIWPSSNLVAINGTHLMGMASLTTNVVSGGGGDYIGITQFLVQPTSYGPITTRMVDRLFDGSEIGYGGFGSITGLDGHQYLFAGDAHKAGKGIKVARHPSNAGAIDRNQSGPYTGDVYYDAYHGTLACIFMESGGGAFFLTYPTGDSLTGPWAEPIQLARKSEPCRDRDKKLTDLNDGRRQDGLSFLDTVSARRAQFQPNASRHRAVKMPSPRAKRATTVCQIRCAIDAIVGALKN